LVASVVISLNAFEWSISLEANSVLKQELYIYTSVR